MLFFRILKFVIILITATMLPIAIFLIVIYVRGGDCTRSDPNDADLSVILKEKSILSQFQNKADRAHWSPHGGHDGRLRRALTILDKARGKPKRKSRSKTMIYTMEDALNRK